MCSDPLALILDRHVLLSQSDYFLLELLIGTLACVRLGLSIINVHHRNIDTHNSFFFVNLVVPG